MLTRYWIVLVFDSAVHMISRLGCVYRVGAVRWVQAYGRVFFVWTFYTLYYN